MIHSLLLLRPLPKYSTYFIGLPNSLRTSNLWFPSLILYCHLLFLSITIGVFCSSLERDFTSLSYLSCFHAFVFHVSGVPPISVYDAISEYFRVGSGSFFCFPFGAFGGTTTGSTFGAIASATVGFGASTCSSVQLFFSVMKSPALHLYHVF